MGTDCWVTELNVCRILKVLDLEGRTWKEWIMNCFFFRSSSVFSSWDSWSCVVFQKFAFPVWRSHRRTILSFTWNTHFLTLALSHIPTMSLDNFSFWHTGEVSYFFFFFVQSSKNPKITIIINNEIAICDTRETVDKASPENELSGDARVSRVSSLLTPERKWKKCHRVTYKIRYVAHCHPKYSVWIS